MTDEVCTDPMLIGPSAVDTVVLWAEFNEIEPAVDFKLTSCAEISTEVVDVMSTPADALTESEADPALDADVRTTPSVVATETVSAPTDTLAEVSPTVAALMSTASVEFSRTCVVPEILTVPASTQVPPSDVQSPSLAALRSGPSAPLRQAPPVPVDDRLTAPPDEDRSTLEPLTLTNGASTVTPSPDVTLMSPVELFIDTPPAPWTSTRPAVASDRTLTLPADEPTVTPSEPLISTDPDDQVCPAEPQADSSAAATTAPALLRHTPAPLPCSNRAPAAVTCTSLPVDATVA